MQKVRMTSKYLIIIITICSSFLACHQQNQYSTISKDETGIIKIDTILFSYLTEIRGDEKIKSYFKYKDKLFTGFAVKYEEANEGTWSFVYKFEKGIAQRIDVYGVNGYQHRFVEMLNGYDHHCIMYHRNGNKYLEEFYDKNKKPIGIWKRWYDTGKLERKKIIIKFFLNSLEFRTQLCLINKADKKLMKNEKNKL